MNFINRGITEEKSREFVEKGNEIYYRA